ncbi:MAG TPA: lamin tail domain-containing protein [Polyangia bacterium]|jgi:hypothetical protein
MLRRAVVVLLAAVALGACSGGTNAPAACTFLAGDLVISEIMADPAGADGTQEWFEIYNASGAELNLAGLSIELAGGRSSKRHLIRAATAPVIPSGGYLALGNGVVAAGGIGYSYADLLGSMPNDAGSLVLRCGTREIDRVDYGAGVAGPGAPTSGKSLQLTGAAPPEYHANDDPANWCDASVAYGDGTNQGTPGAKNSACGSSGCDDGAGGFRALRPPEPGELVITEILSNTPGAEDTDKEWIEVYVAAAVSVDLRDVELIYGDTCQSKTPLAGAGCLTADPGTYIVLARSADPTKNGGLDAPFATFGGSGLRNDAGCVGLRRTPDQAVIDSVTYGTSTDGAAFALGPEHISATDNDEPANWCTATTTYGDGAGKGTPGAPNPPCPGSGCDDGAGGFRPLRLPAAGELVITEIFSNTPGTESANREWLEITNTAAVPIDLLGVALLYGATCQNASPLAGTGCLTVAPGAYVVLARNGDPAQNGGVTAFATFGGSGLINDSGCVALQVTAGALEIDRATYAASTDGRAFNLDPAHISAADNDVAANWCAAQTTFGDGQGRGTPGTANPACGVVFCDDGGTQRPVVAPMPGSLIISEVFANPAGTDVNAKEWLELYVTAGCDLNGLNIVNSTGTTPRTFTISSTACVPVTAGTYALIAGSALNTANGGLPPVTVAVPALSLYNSAAHLSITSGATVIDEANYPTPASGVSSSLNPTTMNVTANDVATGFCAATSTGVFEGTGSPGRVNDACP